MGHEGQLQPQMPTGGEREGGERVGGKGRRSDDWWMGTAQCRKERKRERGRERERMRMVAGGKGGLAGGVRNLSNTTPSPSLSTEKVGAGRVLMALTGMCGSRHRSTNGEPARGDPPKP